MFGLCVSAGLGSTDVTRQVVGGAERPAGSQTVVYSEQLGGQVGESQACRAVYCVVEVREKQDRGEQSRRSEEARKAEHFQSWDQFWGRPGYGAPRDFTHKENLMKTLHFPDESPHTVERSTMIQWFKYFFFTGSQRC